MTTWPAGMTTCTNDSCVPPFCGCCDNCGDAVEEGGCTHGRQLCAECAGRCPECRDERADAGYVRD